MCFCDNAAWYGMKTEKFKISLNGPITPAKAPFVQPVCTATVARMQRTD